MKPETLRNALAFLEQRKDLNDIYKSIQEDLDKVEENLKMFSDSPNRLVSEISTYIFQKKGKRIRPALLLLCTKLIGYQGEEHISMAALVEFIHTASLIHDDIIDNATLRRGRESVHTRWGPNISVLLGDFLYIKTIGLSLQSQYPQIIRILTDISTKMIEGELTEYHMSGNVDLREEDYYDIIQKKTAALFSASCQIGGILGRATPDEERSLLAYGSNLGMTFQIIDDLLDFQGDEKNLGKPTLSDLTEGRITLPLIYTLNNDGNQNRSRLLALLGEKKLPEESKKEILEIVKSNGALDYTYKRAEEFSTRSLEDISQFPESTHREALGLLSGFVLRREK
jgi:octaprenyl-diphosphate synthase